MSDTINAILKKCLNSYLLKKGGQKEVFYANHPEYGDVVIKLGKFSSSLSMERIKREVDFLKNINSIYFPKNYDFILDLKDNEFLIIEEHIKSKKYNEVLRYFDTEEKIISLLRKLINALSELWDNNIVHRDLKPDNILFKEDFSPVIIDLGIARFLDYDSITNTMAFRGPCTPPYAAPEQLLNQKNIINMRTDFFVIGITALELYLGFHPFEPAQVGTGNSIPDNIISGDYFNLKNIRETSDEFTYLVSRLLQPQQFRRFKNYKMIIDFIEQNWGVTSEIISSDWS